MTSPDEQSLADGIRRGDARCEEALYRRYSAAMFRVCLRFARDRGEAEDMLQEGFLRVFADIRDFRGAGSLEGWVRRVVVRACLRVLRQRRVFDALDDVGEPLAEPDGGAEEQLPALDSERIHRLLAELPPGYRTVLSLYALEGYTHEEIAAHLGISVGASKSQLFKARNQLKKLIEKYLIKI